MTVSVRMNPLLENELELAAKRQGVSKSQFIVDAVERALGRKDPYQLLQQVRGEFAALRTAAVPVQEVGASKAARPSTSERLRAKLKSQHDADTRDWQQYQAAKASPGARKSAP
jgi:hypothetical protein